MKRKLIICSSLITLLLACFSVPIYAETTAHDDAGSTPISSSVQLDSYFYQNYDLLPYIESTGEQYIDLGIKGSNSYKTVIRFSNLDLIGSYNGLFGNNTNPRYLTYVLLVNDRAQTYVGSGSITYQINLDPYAMSTLVIDRNNLYLNGILVNSFSGEEFITNDNLFIFGLAPNNALSKYRLYQFTIYDYSSGEEVLLKNYYPAKSKSGGVIGLYDSVSDTFITTSGLVPFSSPLNDQVLNFQIGSFVTNSLTWIGQILTAIIQMPIIIVFMAIGLAGAMFRWGRRIVHF